MPQLCYAEGYTGGAATDLDYINTQTGVDKVEDGDIAIVFDADSNTVTFHQYDASDTQAESPPNVIVPDDNSTGSGRWIMFPAAAYPPNFKDGLTLSQDYETSGWDTDHDVIIATGSCRDSTNANDMDLETALTKKIDAAWAVGTNAGGLDAGSVAADTLYSVWLIKRSDTGVVDALFSTSWTSPTMPTNYDYKRFIGHVWTDASANIIPFRMEGKRMWFLDPDLVEIITGMTAHTTWTLRDTSSYVPTGHFANVLFAGKVTSSASAGTLAFSIDGNHQICSTGCHGTTYNSDSRYGFVTPGGDRSFIPLNSADKIYTQGDSYTFNLMLQAVEYKY